MKHRKKLFKLCCPGCLFTACLTCAKQTAFRMFERIRSHLFREKYRRSANTKPLPAGCPCPDYPQLPGTEALSVSPACQKSGDISTVEGIFSEASTSTNFSSQPILSPFEEVWTISFVPSFPVISSAPS